MAKFIRKELSDGFKGNDILIVAITFDKETNKMAVSYNEVLVPVFNREHINQFIDILTDAFYRNRPDLRPQ